MKKLFLAFGLVLPVAACGGGKPDLPTDEQAWRESYVAAVYTRPSQQTRPLSTDCDFADPAKSAATDEWMALCVLTWERRSNASSPWVEDQMRLRLFYREFTDHSGTAHRWVSDNPLGE